MGSFTGVDVSVQRRNLGKKSAISRVHTAAAVCMHVHVSLCVCGRSCFWNFSNSWKDDTLRWSVSVNVCVHSRVREDFLLGNHSWNERQCREWWNSFMQGARRSWFLVCWSCWSHLRDEMCRESIGVNRRSNVQVQTQPSDKQQGTLLLFTYYCMSVKYNKKQKGERKSTTNPPTAEWNYNRHTKNKRKIELQ